MYIMCLLLADLRRTSKERHLCSTNITIMTIKKMKNRHLKFKLHILYDIILYEQ